tara:strand:- start:125 stop:565 length:441 start_codon:yes stop_codon:yes gene_type:complete
MAYKGKYTVNNVSKYVGDPTKVIYRSLWERRFMVFCDTNDKIIKWASESIVVPYISPVDNRPHRYFVDFIVKYLDKDDKENVSLIEIKPKKQCKEPAKRKKKSRSYIKEMMTWEVNKAKWESARRYADNKGWTFKILTEKELLLGD